MTIDNEFAQYYNFPALRFYSYPGKLEEVPKIYADLYKRERTKKYVCQLKKDGIFGKFVRYNNTNYMNSRNDNDYMNKMPHISEALSFLPDKTVVFGELYYPGRNSSYVLELLFLNDVEKVIQLQTDKNMPGYRGPIYFYIFNIVKYDGMDLTDWSFEKRYLLLQEFMQQNMSPYVQLAELHEDLSGTYEQFVVNGKEEGIVIYNKDATYPMDRERFPKADAIKLKTSMTDGIEVIAIGFPQPKSIKYTGKNVQSWTYWMHKDTKQKAKLTYYEGIFDEYIPITKNYFNEVVSRVEIGAYNDKGAIVSLGTISNFTDLLRVDMRDHPENYLMRPLTITGMEFNYSTLAIRHGRFDRWRDDLKAEDCTLAKIKEFILDNESDS